MLRVEELRKTFEDGTRALDGVSFELQRGEFVAALGASGSGKSTLLRCVNRLVEPTSGRVFFDGQEVTGAPPGRLRTMRRKIGMVFQDYNLVKRVSVLTNVLTGRLGYTPALAGFVNYFSKACVGRALDNLERLGLLDKSYQRVETLSGGQQQRVGIARALMQEPVLILADEPVSSLDPASARAILDILAEINARDGATVLCNLHQPGLARQYARRIIALKKGRKVFDGEAGAFDEEAERLVYGPV
ncbi:MAG: phosphonate ABC transporter ATP-binding protein [Nitrospinae bacterium]|nr:phosphonate ABC transporter ATP-binding protein [Nitrospinota bacterium]